jgi:hypothetical protein
MPKLRPFEHKGDFPNVIRYNDINALHNCDSKTAYNLLLKLTIRRWAKDKELVAFHDYFKLQWIDSVFCDWQIFLTPAGYAHTNSPIESYNIKAQFTKRIKHHLKSAMDVFNEVIDYESKNIKKLYKEGKVTQFLKKQAKAISSKLRPCGFKRYEYTQIDGFLATINTETKCCTCQCC